MSNPKTHSNDKKTVRVAVLLPPDVRDRAAEIAAQYGLPLGTWIRMQIIRQTRSQDCAGS